MKKSASLILATIVAFASISCGWFAPKPTQLPTITLNDNGATVIDQSFTGDTNMGAEINSGYLYAAQTFTARVDGVLAGISIDVGASSIGTLPLHVALRPVAADGTPAAYVLAEVTLDSQGAPPTHIISFPQTVTIKSGERYAIVVNYEGGAALKGKPLGGWAGATGDPYPAGKTYASESDGVTWTSTMEGDFHFQTFVTRGFLADNGLPLPTNVLLPFATDVPRSIPTNTASSRPPATSPVHVSVTAKGLTYPGDQLALTSGDNETHRYCFSGCRDVSDLVEVAADKIVVHEGYPITYDQWTVMLEIAPNDSYAINSLEIDIFFKGEDWICLNTLGPIGPQNDYLMGYVADMNVQANGVPVLALPQFFTCSKSKD